VIRGFLHPPFALGVAGADCATAREAKVAGRRKKVSSELQVGRVSSSFIESLGLLSWSLDFERDANGDNRTTRGRDFSGGV